MKKLSLLVVAFLLTFKLAVADEGMWLLPLIQKLNADVLKKAGLKISAEDIYSINKSSLKDAILIFGGGCTGSVISKEGLVLTNHHCGYGNIQRLSTMENNYLRDGFWAMSRQEEIPVPGLSVTFIDRMEDVTAQMNQALKDCTTEADRARVIAATGDEISKKAVGDNPYLRARVASMYGGNMFYLVVTKAYNDVRLVGTPPSSIGRYGGDTDNWIWPRHTGDFAIFRIYADKDNNPVAYDPSNQPYKPIRHLTISLAGVKEGDFNMIIGQPGRTTRFMTSSEVKEQRDIVNEIGIYARTIYQDIVQADMLADPKVQLQYASKFSGSSNWWKKWTGMSETFAKLDVVNRRAEEEKAFEAWVAAHPTRQANYGTAIGDINNAVAGRRDLRYQQTYLTESLNRMEIVSFAGQLQRFLPILEKGDQKEIQDFITGFRSAATRFFDNYNQPTDRKICVAMLRLYAEEIERADQPSFYQTIRNDYNRSIDAFVNDMFAKSFFATSAKLEAFLQNPTAEALKNDPAFMVNTSIAQKAAALAAQIAPFNEQVSKAQRAYIAGTLERNQGKALYPDANSTLRLTYGHVKSYVPRDAVEYNFYTSHRGILEKEDFNWEFEVPPRLKELLQNKDFGRYANAKGELSICFINNLDITNGNSGSPVLNAKGELIGCAFDGNWEAMSADVIFEPELQRSISVDIRYVLWVVDKFGGAGHLISEMTIAR
ncbi:MAG: S46 family peptidase [Bacteroidales bacterium]|nr:S46 family peptidase [Bacteroidales bacterium]